MSQENILTIIIYVINIALFLMFVKVYISNKKSFNLIKSCFTLNKRGKLSKKNYKILLTQTSISKILYATPKLFILSWLQYLVSIFSFLYIAGGFRIAKVFLFTFLLFLLNLLPLILSNILAKKKLNFGIVFFSIFWIGIYFQIYENFQWTISNILFKNPHLILLIMLYIFNTTVRTLTNVFGFEIGKVDPNDYE